MVSAGKRTSVSTAAAHRQRRADALAAKTPVWNPRHIIPANALVFCQQRDSHPLPRGPGAANPSPPLSMRQKMVQAFQPQRRKTHRKNTAQSRANRRKKNKPKKTIRQAEARHVPLMEELCRRRGCALRADSAAAPGGGVCV